MPLVIEEPFVRPRRTNVLFMLDEWSASAALTTTELGSGNSSEAGTSVTDLQRPQPRDFWGHTSPATIFADRQDRGVFGGIFLPFASVPRETTWRRRYGDSAAERDGTHLRDASGNNRRIILRNGAACGAGLFLGGLVLDASGTQYAETEAAFPGPNFGTIELHVQGARRAQWLFYHDGGDGVSRGLYMDANGIVHVYRGGVSPVLSSSVAIADDGGWHQIAYHFDDVSTGACSLDLDGEEVAVDNNFSDPPTGVLTLGNGYAAIAPNAASTTLDEIRYWPLARSVAEVQRDMVRELDDSEAPQLAAYYRCNAFDSGEQLFAAPAAYDLWTMPDPRCHGWDFLEAPWAARSSRIDITGPADGEILRFGNLLMGATYQPTQQSAEKGRNYGSVDDTEYDRGPGGELAADPVGPYRATEFTVAAIPQSEIYGDWERLQLLFAGGRPGLVALNPADPIFQHHKLYFGVVKMQLFTERNWDYHVASVRVEGMP